MPHSRWVDPVAKGHPAHMWLPCFVGLVSFFLLGAPPEGPSTAVAPVQLPSLSQVPVIDGTLSPDEWKSARKLPLRYQIQPGDNSEPSESTEVLIGHTREYLFLAIHALDSSPASIRARVTRRDDVFNDDYVSVFLDTYNDRQRAYAFHFNPLGIQADGIYTQSASDDLTWDGILQSKGRVGNDGYVIEMAIPFKTMRFKTGKDVVWGLQIRRWIARKAERISWQPESRDTSGFLVQMGTLSGLEDIFAGRTVDVTPTLTGSVTGERQPDESLNRVNKLEPGLTVTWSLTPNMTLTATANPDFSQVEADVPQINVNQRFALFFPERRSFFLEGSEFFRELGGTTIVNTRTIVDPDWGLKFTGKIGRNTLAFLAASDRAAGKRVDSTDPGFGQNARFQVLRYQRDLMKDSAIGAFLTNVRFGTTSNTVAAVDARIRVRPDANLFGQLAYTSTREADGSTSRGQSVYFKYNQYSRNWRFVFEEQKVDPNFRNDVGFIDRTGFHGQFVDVGYEFRPKTENRWFVSIWPYIVGYRSRTPDGQPELQYVDPALQVILPRGIQVNYYYSFDRDGFAGKVLSYQFQSLSYSVNRFKKVEFSGRVTTGEELNLDPNNTVVGNTFSMRHQITLRPNDRINSELLFLKSRLQDKATKQNFFDLNIIRNRTVLQFTANTAFRSIVEYNTLERRLGVSLLYSYTPKPNTAVFVGYDDLLFNGVDPLTKMRQPGIFRQRQTFFFKLSYNFRF